MDDFRGSRWLCSSPMAGLVWRSRHARLGAREEVLHGPTAWQGAAGSALGPRLQHAGEGL